VSGRGGRRNAAAAHLLGHGADVRRNRDGVGPGHVPGEEAGLPGSNFSGVSVENDGGRILGLAYLNGELLPGFTAFVRSHENVVDRVLRADGAGAFSVD